MVGSKFNIAHELGPLRHAQCVPYLPAHRLHPGKKVLYRNRAKDRGCQAEQDEQRDDAAK